MQTTDSEEIINSVRDWLENVVIGLNLCPFAKKEYVKQRIRFQLIDVSSDEDLLLALNQELEYLFANDEVETSLLILPNHLQNFVDYNQFLDLADALIEQMDFLGEFQVASFHPDYQFADTEVDDLENYTNRSPYPILHILREASLENAIARYPDVEKIPDNNIALLESMGIEKIKELYL
ncbi:MAG: DUF1415 domain-containing protein [Gammaproteobacteria bacterium]|nr:DUF1415 domain-containing protein [Gammaproteobacteria bacterium]